MRKDIDISREHVINRYIVSLVFSIIGAIINFWFFRATLIYISEETFYYYSYARRVISFISPVLLLGLGVAIPRSIGLNIHNSEKANNILISALLIILIVSFLWYIINLFFNNWLTLIIWGEINDVSIKLNKAISIYFSGLNITACLHSYFRGRIKIFYSGLLELIALTIIPLIAFLYFTDLVKIYNFITLCLIVINVFIILGINNKGINIKLNELFVEIKTLLKYGILRVPGDIVLALLLFLPAYIASLKFGLEYAGIISFGSALITLANLPATAISFVSLSRFTHILKIDKNKLKKEIVYIVIGSFVYGVVVSLVLFFSLGFIINFFLEESILKYIGVLKLIIWAITPFIIFTILRSIIDAAHKKPYNTYNIIVSATILFIFSIFSVRNDNIKVIIYGIICSYIVLAVLSLFKTIKIFKSNI